MDKMDVFEAIHQRKSVRAYEQMPISVEVLSRILEAGRIAPSAGNRQPWHFIVVNDSEKRKELSKGTFAKFLTEAPTVIVGCGDSEASKRWYPVDVSIAMENMVLAATGEGLGTCWVGSFNEESVKKLLEIPDKYRIVSLLAIGYIRERFDAAQKILQLVSKRKTLKEITSLDGFGKAYV
jgi:nitroreductase